MSSWSSENLSPAALSRPCFTLPTWWARSLRIIAAHSSIKYAYTFPRKQSPLWKRVSPLHRQTRVSWLRHRVDTRLSTSGLFAKRPERTAKRAQRWWKSALQYLTGSPQLAPGLEALRDVCVFVSARVRVPSQETAHCPPAVSPRSADFAQLCASIHSPPLPLTCYQGTKQVVERRGYCSVFNMLHSPLPSSARSHIKRRQWDCRSNYCNPWNFITFCH